MRGREMVAWAGGVLLLITVAGAEQRAGGAPGGTPGPGNLGFDPASDTEDSVCLNPTGDNLNEMFGLSENVIGPPPCADPPFSGHFVVNAGEFAVTVLRWIANAPEGTDDFPLVYPAGYVPSGSPAEDAVSKIVSVRVVIDGKRELVYPAEDVLEVLEGLRGLPPGLFQVTFLPMIPPQSIGVHRIDYFWTFSAELCDGLFEEDCVPPGEWPFAAGGFDFEVVRRSPR